MEHRGQQQSLGKREGPDRVVVHLEKRGRQGARQSPTREPLALRGRVVGQAQHLVGESEERNQPARIVQLAAMKQRVDHKDGRQCSQDYLRKAERCVGDLHREHMRRPQAEHHQNRVEPAETEDHYGCCVQRTSVSLAFRSSTQSSRNHRDTSPIGYTIWLAP